MTDLPRGWTWATVGDLAQYTNGFAFKPEDRSDTGLPIVRIQNLTDPNRPLNLTRREVPDEFKVRRGELLVSWSATLDVFRWHGSDALVNQHIFRVVPEVGNVCPSWLQHWLKVAIAQMQDTEHLHGSTMKHINRGPFLAHAVPMPPIYEQRRIADKLDELLSELEGGTAELRAAQVKLQRYRQSLLKAAVEGDLTADWRAANPPAETGAELLQRILADRRSSWEDGQRVKAISGGRSRALGGRSKYPEPIGPVSDERPNLPEGWALASLGQLLAHLTSGSRDWAPFYDKGTCVFVMAQNVRTWRPDFSFRQLVDPPLGHRDRDRSQIIKDDLLLTIVGANTGQVCRVAEDVESHFVCQSVALLRLVEPALAEYVNAVLNSEGHGQRQFREMNYGAGRPHLSFEQIESVVVPLPPLAEARAIVDALEAAFADLAGVEESAAKALALAQAQRQNILRAAFAGQLVPQDPTDEPAEALLARIRASREGVKPPTRKRRHPAGARVRG